MLPIFRPGGQVFVHVPALCRAHKVGLDGLSSGGELVDDGQIEIAVEDQGQGPRNGCCAHDQHVGAAALLLHGGALLDAEAVLLVTDHHAEIAEPYILGEQRVGAGNGLPGPALNVLQRLPLLLLGLAAQQKAAAVSKKVFQGFVVLSGQYLRGGQQHPLAAVTGGGVQGE